MFTLTHLMGFGAFAPTYITSVQPFEITIPTGATSATGSLTAVNTSRSVIFFNGFTTTHTGTAQQEYRPRVELTNGTTVTAYRDISSASQSVTVRGTVVEFSSLMVNSVQHGTITVASSAASGTQTITSVATARAAVLYLGNTNTTSTTAIANTYVALDLTNATTVTATRAVTATAVLTVGFCVVEFNESAVKSVQKRSVVLTSSTTGSTDTITSVATGQTMLLYNGAYSNNATLANFCYNLQLTNATTVTLTRTGTASTSRTVNYTVVEFQPGVIASVQRGTTSVASATSADSAITAVTTGKALCNQLNFSQTSTTAAQLYATAKLLNATTVRGEKNTAGVTTSVPGWEVVEFV